MRRAAVSMAACCSLLTLPSADSISAADNFSVSTVMPALSKRLVSSTSASSPRARTSAMMPRTTCATSSSSSRLAKSNFSKSAAKDASAAFSLRAIAIPRRNILVIRRAARGLFMVGAASGRPWLGQIGQLGLDAFHRQADGAAAGQHQLDHAAGIFAALIWRKPYRQQIDHRFFGAQLDLVRLNLEHAVEMKAGAHPRLAALFPFEPVHHRGEAALSGLPAHILELQHRVLQPCRQNLQVLGVARRQPEARQSDTRAMSAPTRDSFSSSRSKPRSR